MACATSIACPRLAEKIGPWQSAKRRPVPHVHVSSGFRSASACGSPGLGHVGAASPKLRSGPVPRHPAGKAGGVARPDLLSPDGRTHLARPRGRGVQPGAGRGGRPEPDRGAAAARGRGGATPAMPRAGAAIRAPDPATLPPCARPPRRGAASSVRPGRGPSSGTPARPLRGWACPPRPASTRRTARPGGRS